MGLLDGKLAKMLILSFATDDDGLMKGIPVPFPVMYNPEKFSKSIRTRYQRRQVPGDAGEELSFEGIEGDEISFEFLFDATGGSINSIQGEAAKALDGVDVQIELFLALTHSRDPNEHQPPKLTLVWGTFIFDCRLVNATIDYTLFNSLGRPLRATINATFKGDEPRILQAAFDKLFSADLTHARIVKDGETLPMISKEVYGDPKYYLEIARVNNLTNFRSIPAGTELILPPLDKTEK
ncbi:CIS tube protein [Marinigracilibium pacificum]|uniref:LysM peptidoglycan-binding domain-containing protein n=1 Tax=Marinigracilibium pacificum TaxID=2729599 RepID=A0A848J2W8_9BACT|nr:LysM peptidoglycan-binding domain-containing protein [Marinigracilibium pacificum]NMM49678.1 LysM peptidoglycan-binding domain-containing protein [Marinigracilibium pacificum]